MEIYFKEFLPLVILFSAFLLARYGSMQALGTTILMAGTFFLLAVFFAYTGNYFMAGFELALTLLTVWVYRKSQEQLRKLRAENEHLKKKLEEELRTFEAAILDRKQHLDKIKQN